MLKKIFAEQQALLTQFYDQLDYTECEALLEHLFRSSGVVFCTGVGKSGFVAQKVAATLMSTGTKAFFLSPIDALHGDLGMVDSKDSILIFSKSGETQELLELLPSLRNKDVQIIAITSNRESRLNKSADLFVHLSCSKELCPYDLAPTVSTEIQLLFGDVLAMALMEKKGFSLDAYAKNHPGGRIGKRASMRVCDLMLDRERTPVCLPDALLEEALIEFTDKRCGCLIVIDQNKRLKGIFTDGDLRRALQQKGEQVLKEKMGDLLNPYAKSVSADMLAYDAMQKMESDQKHPVMVLPVCEEDEVIGIIKMHDLVQANL